MKFLKWLLFTPTYDWVIDTFLGVMWWLIGMVTIMWLWSLLFAAYWHLLG